MTPRFHLALTPGFVLAQRSCSTAGFRKPSSNAIYCPLDSTLLTNGGKKCKIVISDSSKGCSPFSCRAVLFSAGFLKGFVALRPCGAMALQLLPYPYILCTSGLSFLLNNHHQIIQFEGRFIISQQILFFFFFFCQDCRFLVLRGVLSALSTSPLQLKFSFNSPSFPPPD